MASYICASCGDPIPTNNPRVNPRKFMVCADCDRSLANEFAMEFGTPKQKREGARDERRAYHEAEDAFVRSVLR